jgi:hypothetical protein
MRSARRQPTEAAGQKRPWRTFRLAMVTSSSRTRGGCGRAERAVVADLVPTDVAAERRAPHGGGHAELDGERSGLRRLEAARERAPTLDGDLAARFCAR